jgi:hypothetical protein
LSTNGDEWALKDSAPDRTVKKFDTKAEATEDGAREKALGPNGGSARIEKERGEFQEERTYRRSKDPKKSPG